jgi:hypothetical protein
MTDAELNALFPDRAALIAASGIKRCEGEAFIPWACVLSAPAAALDAAITTWRAIEDVQPLPSANVTDDDPA